MNGLNPVYSIGESYLLEAMSSVSTNAHCLPFFVAPVLIYLSIYQPLDGNQPAGVSGSQRAEVIIQTISRIDKRKSNKS